MGANSYSRDGAAKGFEISCPASEFESRVFAERPCLQITPECSGLNGPQGGGAVDGWGIPATESKKFGELNRSSQLDERGDLVDFVLKGNTANLGDPRKCLMPVPKQYRIG